MKTTQIVISYDTEKLTALRQHASKKEVSIETELTENGFSDVNRLYSVLKDWNEDIKARLGLNAITAKPHPKVEVYRNVVIDKNM